MDRQQYRPQGGAPRPQGGGNRSQGGEQRFAEENPRPTEQDLKAIIQEGHSEKLVKWAEAIGKTAAPGLSSAQIRGVFGTVRRIEMIWHRQANKTEENMAVRQLLLLKPKMAYNARRSKKMEFEYLSGVLTPAIDMVQGQRERFVNFVDFFEAIVAYHKAYGRD